MAVKDSARFLSETLDSLEGQTLKNWELVAVDDGSADDSAAIIRARLGNQAVVSFTSGNRGPAVARNQAIELARAPYLAILDSDDLSSPLRLERQVEYLERNQQWSACATLTERLGSQSKCILGGHPGTLRACLIFCHPVIHSTMMVRRSALAAGPTFDESLRFAHDYDLVIRLAFGGGIMTLQEVLGSYRVHDRQVSQANMKKQDAFAMQIQGRLLTQLGMQPSLSELSVHFRLGRGAGLTNIGELRKASIWLDKMRTANLNHKLVSDSELTDVTNYFWSKTCINSSVSLVDAIHFYRNHVQRTCLISHKIFLLGILGRVIRKCRRITKVQFSCH